VAANPAEHHDPVTTASISVPFVAADHNRGLALLGRRSERTDRGPSPMARLLHRSVTRGKSGLVTHCERGGNQLASGAI